MCVGGAVQAFPSWIFPTRGDRGDLVANHLGDCRQDTPPSAPKTVYMLFLSGGDRGEQGRLAIFKFAIIDRRHQRSASIMHSEKKLLNIYKHFFLK